MPFLFWINGREQQSIAATDRGLHYGDGLFETLLYLKSDLKGKLVLEKEHLARLQRDASRLRLVLDEQKLRIELAAFLKRLNNSNAASGVVKILVTRQFSGRGYGPDNKAGSNRILQFFPGINYPEANRQGIHLTLLPERLSLNPALAGIKHLNRLEQVLAQSHIKKPFTRGIAYQEGVLLDQQQAVTEAVHSNIFIVKEGVVLTPLLDRAGVRGVMRDFILLSVCRRLKIPAREQRISLADLLNADEVFTCNSVYGIWPVSQLDVKSYHRGAVTGSLQNSVDALGYAEIHH